MFSWLRGGMADTMRSTENRGLSCQQRNAQHHSNTRRKIPARVRFSAERVFRETKKTRSRNLDRRSPSQKAKQQNARKPANHLRGYRTEVLGKISGVKVRTEIESESARQTWARNWRQFAGTSCAIAPHWSINSLPRRILDEIWRRDRKNEQRGAEKPILRKPTFRTDEMGPISGKYGFVLLHLRFTARRRQLTALPGIILEFTSSYGGIRSVIENKRRPT